MERRLAVGACVALIGIAVQARAWFVTVDGVNARTTGVISDDTFRRVIVDPAGDVLAAGVLSTLLTTPFPLADGRAMVTKRAGADGTLVWQTLLGQQGAFNVPASVLGMALTSTGDVLVNGAWSAATPGLLTFAVARVGNASGAIAWERNILGTSTTDHAFASGVAVDANDDVVAAGNVANTGSGSDAAAYKLDGATGATIWTREIDGPGAGNDHDTFTRVVLDGSGDAFVIESLDFVRRVRKLSGVTGADAWPAPVALASAWDLAVDPAGDVVVTDSASLAPAVTKLAGADGSVLWQHVVAPTWAGTLYRPVFDGSDPVIPGALGGQFVVLKLDGASGAESWTYTGVLTAEAIGAAVDGIGTVAAGGTIFHGGTLYDFYAVRLDALTGAPLATYRIDGGAEDTDWAEAFALAPDGQIVMAGEVGEGGAQAPEEYSDDAALVRFDDRLAGKSITALDQGTASKLLVRARDTHLLASAPGGPEDPTLAGATLVVTNPTTLESAVFVLPAARWTASGGNKPGKQQYKYSDPLGSDGPCRSAVVKSGRVFKVKCLGSLGGFTLDEASQGALHVRFRLGTVGGPYCFVFGGVTVDQPGQFKGRAAPAPASCDYASASGAFVD